MDFIDSAVGWLGMQVKNTIPEGPLSDLLVDGIIGGVGGVIIFLPNILILFFFISFMEDTGYMARASFIMDKLMHKIGLHGKSFIPMLMGFGCNVPAVMATRTLENRKDRLLTMLIIPFMSCSARLPVYVLLISAFFPAKSGTGTGINLSDRGPGGYSGCPRNETDPFCQTGCSICDGTAALQDADTEKHIYTHVAQRSSVSQKNGNNNTCCFNHYLGTGLFSPQCSIFKRL